MTGVHNGPVSSTECVADVEIRPATAERFADVARVLAPKKADAPVCWCLSYRLPNAENHVLRGPDRPARLRSFCQQDPPPGLVAYVDGEPAGWCSVGLRATLPRLVNSRTIPRVDDIPAWSVICFVIRSGYRRLGLTHQLLAAAVTYARLRGPRTRGLPGRPAGGRISSSLAYVGTTSLFEAAGFRRVQPTAAKSGGATRWLMRLTL